MNLALALVASEAIIRVLGVLGFLVLLPLIVWVASRVGRHLGEKRNAHEFAVEVKTADHADDDWLQRTING
ncbi:MAG: hypothetical protein ACOH1Y_16565 [Propionicimonas sp.]